MSLETLHQKDDDLVSQFVLAQRAYLTGRASSMSQENLFGNANAYDAMRASLEEAVQQMHSTPAGEEAVRAGKRFVLFTGVATLVTYGIIFAGVAVAMVKLLQYRTENIDRRKAVVAEMRKEILKASRPGMKITLHGGDDEKLGRLMINGKPASMVRGELEKMVASDKAMTPEEHERAIKLVRNGSAKFLEDMDRIKSAADEYKRKQTMGTLGVVGLYVIFSGAAFISWLGYRIYLFLARKLG